MLNWWLYWAERLAVVLAEVWLRAKSGAGGSPAAPPPDGAPTPVPGAPPPSPGGDERPR